MAYQYLTTLPAWCPALDVRTGALPFPVQAEKIIKTCGIHACSILRNGFFPRVATLEDDSLCLAELPMVFPLEGDILGCTNQLPTNLLLRPRPRKRAGLNARGHALDASFTGLKARAKETVQSASMHHSQGPPLGLTPWAAATPSLPQQLRSRNEQLRSQNEAMATNCSDARIAFELARVAASDSQSMAQSAGAKVLEVSEQLSKARLELAEGNAGLLALSASIDLMQTREKREAALLKVHLLELKVQEGALAQLRAMQDQQHRVPTPEERHAVVVNGVTGRVAVQAGRDMHPSLAFGPGVSHPESDTTQDFAFNHEAEESIAIGSTPWSRHSEWGTLATDVQSYLALEVCLLGALYRIQFCPTVMGNMALRLKCTVDVVRGAVALALSSAGIQNQPALAILSFHTMEIGPRSSYASALVTLVLQTPERVTSDSGCVESIIETVNAHAAKYFLLRPLTAEEGVELIRWCRWGQRCPGQTTGCMADPVCQALARLSSLSADLQSAWAFLVVSGSAAQGAQGGPDGPLHASPAAVPGPSLPSGSSPAAAVATGENPPPRAPSAPRGVPTGASLLTSGAVGMLQDLSSSPAARATAASPASSATGDADPFADIGPDWTKPGAGLDWLEFNWGPASEVSAASSGIVSFDTQVPFGGADLAADSSAVAGRGADESDNRLLASVGPAATAHGHYAARRARRVAFLLAAAQDGNNASVTVVAPPAAAAARAQDASASAVADTLGFILDPLFASYAAQQDRIQGLCIEHEEAKGINQGALEVALQERHSQRQMVGHLHSRLGVLEAVYSEALDHAADATADHVAASAAFSEHLAQAAAAVAPDQSSVSFGLSPLQNHPRAPDGDSWRHTPEWGAPGQSASGIGMKRGVVDHHWLKDHTVNNMPIALWSQVHPRAAYGYAMWAWQHCYKWLVLWMGTAHADFLKRVCYGDGPGLWQLLKEHYDRPSIALAASVRQECRNIQMDKGTLHAPLLSCWENWDGFTRRVALLEAILWSCTPKQQQGSYLTPFNEGWLREQIRVHMPKRYQEPLAALLKSKRCHQGNMMDDQNALVHGAGICDPVTASAIELPLVTLHALVARVERDAQGKAGGLSKEWREPAPTPRGQPTRRVHLANGALEDRPISGSAPRGDAASGGAAGGADQCMEAKGSADSAPAWSSKLSSWHPDSHPDMKCGCGKSFNAGSIKCNKEAPFYAVACDCFVDGGAPHNFCSKSRHGGGRGYGDKRHLNYACGKLSKEIRERYDTASYVELDKAVEKLCKEQRLCFSCGRPNCSATTEGHWKRTCTAEQQKAWVDKGQSELLAKHAVPQGGDQVRRSRGRGKRKAASHAARGGRRKRRPSSRPAGPSASAASPTTADGLCRPPLRDPLRSDSEADHGLEMAGTADGALDAWQASLQTGDRQRGVQRWREGRARPDNAALGASRETAQSATPGAATRAWQPVKVMRAAAPARLSGQPDPAWCVDMTSVTTLGEVLDNLDTLYLTLSNSADFLDPMSQPWMPGGTAHLQCSPNVAPLRPGVPPKDPRSGGRYGTDFATAFALMQTGVFKRLVISEPVRRLASARSAIGKWVKSQLNDLNRNRHAAEGPAFMRGLNQERLLELHRQRVSSPSLGKSFLSVCCGISGEFKAFLASGCDERKSVLVTCCAHDTAILRQRYPLATIIEGDVRDPALWAAVQEAASGVDIAMVAVLCQPSSNASTVHDPKDIRIATGMMAVDLAVSCHPTLMVIENVSSMKQRQPAAYKALVDTVLGEFPRLCIRSLDAKLCLVPSTRNRCFFIGHRNLDLTPMLDACKRQSKLYKSKKYVPLSVLQGLAPYKGLIKTDFKAYMGPHRRGTALSKGGRPQRLYDATVGHICITTRMGTRGGNSPAKLAAYVPHDADAGGADIMRSDMHCLPRECVGVMLGFALKTPWSPALRCFCVGCVDLRGKCRGPCGERAQGDAISPPQIFFLTRFITRAMDKGPVIAGVTPDPTPAVVPPATGGPSSPGGAPPSAADSGHAKQAALAALCATTAALRSATRAEEAASADGAAAASLSSSAASGLDGWYWATSPGAVHCFRSRGAPWASSGAAHRKWCVSAGHDFHSGPGYGPAWQGQDQPGAVQLEAAAAAHSATLAAVHAHLGGQRLPSARLQPRTSPRGGADPGLTAHVPPAPPEGVLSYELDHLDPKPPLVAQWCPRDADTRDAKRHTVCDSWEDWGDRLPEGGPLDADPKVQWCAGHEGALDTDGRWNSGPALAHPGETHHQIIGTGTPTPHSSIWRTLADGTELRPPPASAWVRAYLSKLGPPPVPACDRGGVEQPTVVAYNCCGVEQPTGFSEVLAAVSDRNQAGGNTGKLKLEEQANIDPLSEMHELMFGGLCESVELQSASERLPMNTLTLDSLAITGLTLAYEREQQDGDLLLDLGPSGHHLFVEAANQCACCEKKYLGSCNSSAPDEVCSFAHTVVDEEHIESLGSALLDGDADTARVALLACDDSLAILDEPLLRRCCAATIRCAEQHATRVTREAERRHRGLGGGVPINAEQLAAAHAYAASLPSASVSDEQAAVELRLMHQRMGHASLRFLRQMHNSGTLLGPEMSADQFDCVQFWCPVCAKTRRTRKPHVRHRKQSPKELGRLDQVYLDVSRKRPVTSRPVRGVRGNQTGGGNQYSVYYFDKESNHLWTSYISHKSDLEDDLAKMCTQLTMDARHCLDHDGKNDISVKMIVSDRDSNLLSDKAVAYMLKHKIHHRLTAADAKNQTPALDNVIRRVQNITASLLHQAGLGQEYWELAETMAAELVNCFPTKRHPLHWSARQRWDGVPPDMSNFYTFGADAYVQLKPHERTPPGKLGEKTTGGNGTYRYVGPEKGVGFDGMGSLILNTLTGVMRCVRDVELDEDMDKVSKYRIPAPDYPSLEPKAEDVLIDEHDDGQFLDATPSGHNDLDVPYQPGEPIVIGDQVSKDNPQMYPTPGTWRYAMWNTSSLDTPKKKAVRVTRAKAKSSKVTTRAGRKKASKDGVHVKRLSQRLLSGLVGKRRKPQAAPLPLDTELWVRQNNPKGADTKCWHRYQRYRRARSVKEFLDFGGTRRDLGYDIGKGYITLKHAQACWIRPPPCLSTACVAHEEQRELQARAQYVLQAEAYCTRREEDDSLIPAGVAAADKLMSVWAAHAGEESLDYVDMALAGVHTLATEFAQWHLHSWSASGAMAGRDASEEMQIIMDMAERVFETCLTTHHANLVKELQHLHTSQIPTPKRFKDAVSGEFKKYWLEAIAREVANLKEHEVFEWVPAPPGRKLIDSNWAWKVKTNDKGQVSKFKARLVARGFRQIYGVDYVDTMAPVGKLTTFRVLLAEGAHRGMDISFVDIRSAYLEAELKIKQFMTPPQGVLPPKAGHVMRLDKGLYGLKQSGREWHIKFKKNLLSWGFKCCTADPCLFVRQRGGVQIRILLFVDDMAIFSDSGKKGDALKEELIQAVKTAGYDYSSSDDDNVYLGMAVTRINPTCLALSQERYIKDIMIKYGFADQKATYTTSNLAKVSVADCPSTSPKDNPLGRRFREMTGALRWIEQCTRPDISAVLSELSKVQINPGQVHLDQLEHLMRYVNTTQSFSLVYGGPSKDTMDGVLTGSTDSDWAGDADTSYSRAGYVICMWQTPVSWASQKMKAAAASSCESEYMAASRAVRESIWLRYLLSDMGYGDLTTTTYGKFCDRDFVKVRLSALVDPREVLMTFVCDNMGAIALSENPVLHKRSKHIHLAYHIVRRMVEKKHVKFAYINTKENIADLMTKSLGKKTHYHLLDKIMCRVVDSKLCSLEGDALDWTPRPADHSTLYKNMPLGLEPGRNDHVTRSQPSLPTKLWKGELLAPGGLDPADRYSCSSASPSNPFLAALSTPLTDLDFSDDGTMSDHEWAQVAADLVAIIDSGASHTYRGGLVKLLGERPGLGHVSVANGQREKIDGIGRYGPLSDVRRVSGFPRTLVSVSDLVEQFGFIVFDSFGCYVVTPLPSGVPIVTQIGLKTRNRLFSFDIKALAHHGRAMRTAGLVASPRDGATSLLDAMGVR